MTTGTTPRIENIADGIAAIIAPDDASHFSVRKLLRDDLIEFAKEIKLAAIEGEFR